MNIIEQNSGKLSVAAFIVGLAVILWMALGYNHMDHPSPTTRGTTYQVWRGLP